MKIYCVLLLFLFSCSPDNSQESRSERLIAMCEKGVVKDPARFFTKELLTEPKRERLDSVIKVFSNEYSRLPRPAKRGLVWVEDNGNVFRYRYFTDKGTELLLDLVYDFEKTNLLVKRVSFMGIDSFAKERVTQRVPYETTIE